MNRSAAILPAKQVHAWEEVSDLFQITNERDFDRMTALINSLADKIGDDLDHPLSGLLDTLITVAHAYEEAHHHIPDASPVDIIKNLMQEHGLNQKDLPEIGSQGVVSEILRGLRPLNLRQIGALAKRFGLPPAVFLED